VLVSATVVLGTEVPGAQFERLRNVVLTEAIPCMSKTSYSLTLLNLPAPIDRSVGYGVRADLRSGHGPRCRAFTCGPAPGDPGVAPSIACAATVATPTDPSRQSGPMALRVAVRHLAQLADGARHRKARNRRGLASQGVSAVLDVEESARHKPSARFASYPGADLKVGARESTLGRATGTRRVRAAIEVSSSRTWRCGSSWLSTVAPVRSRPFVGPTDCSGSAFGWPGRTGSRPW